MTDNPKTTLRPCITPDPSTVKVYAIEDLPEEDFQAIMNAEIPTDTQRETALASMEHIEWCLSNPKTYAGDLEAQETAMTVLLNVTAALKSPAPDVGRTRLQEIIDLIESGEPFTYLCTKTGTKHKYSTAPVVDVEFFRRLACWAYLHEEISIGRCRELTGWNDYQIKDFMEAQNILKTENPQ